MFDHIASGFHRLVLHEVLHNLWKGRRNVKVRGGGGGGGLMPSFNSVDSRLRNERIIRIPRIIIEVLRAVFYADDIGRHSSVA